MERWTGRYWDNGGERALWIGGLVIVIWTIIFYFVSTLFRLPEVYALQLFGYVIHVMIRGYGRGRVVLRAKASSPGDGELSQARVLTIDLTTSWSKTSKMQTAIATN